MGVTRRSIHLDDIRPIRVEDAEEFNYADYDLTESGDEAASPEQSAEARTSRSKKNKDKRAEKKFRKIFGDIESDGIRVKNNMGSRKHRRLENVRLLLSYTDRDDICTDFSDLVPHTITAFEQLLAEKENMRIWNEFIEKEEEEQREILETGLWLSEEERRKEWFVVNHQIGGKSTPKRKNEDERQHHPAYSARSCFELLDKRSKKLLSEKHLPWGFVAYVEKQLRDFFAADSDGVFVGRFECSLQRALLHAVAQFLRLSSKSSTDTSTLARITEIRNARAYFIPPRTELIPYLSTLRPEPIDYVVWEPEKKESTDCSFRQS